MTDLSDRSDREGDLFDLDESSGDGGKGDKERVSIDESPFAEDTDDLYDSIIPEDEEDTSSGIGESQPSEGDTSTEKRRKSGQNGQQNAGNARNAGNAGSRTRDPSLLPPEPYERLPATITDVCDCLDGHEKDVFLTSCLPVFAGGMHNAAMRYGGEWLRLNLYTAVVAPPGSGKSKMRIAKRIGQPLNRRLRNRSEARIEEWEQMKADPDQEAGKRPAMEVLFLAADSSASALKHELNANHHGVILDTDANTISNVLTREWGQFGDVLLKSFPNEPVTVSRRKDDRLDIDRPALSLGLAGTPSSISEIVEGADDGLFSRFCFYHFDEEPEWKPQFQDDEDPRLADAKDRAAQRLDGIYEDLSGRNEPLYCRIPSELQEIHTAAFKNVMEHLKKKDAPRIIIPSVKRAGVVALRIASISGLIRLYEQGGDLSAAKSMVISKDDLAAGMYLALAYLSHGLRVIDQIGRESKGEDLHEGQRDYLDALPDCPFDTKDAKDIAEEKGIAERTAMGWLRKFADNRLLVDAGKGSWRWPDDVPSIRYRSLLSALL